MIHPSMTRCALALGSAVAMWTVSLNVQAQEGAVESRTYTLAKCPATAVDVYAPPAVGIGAAVPVAAMIVSAVVSPLIDAVVDKGVEALKQAAADKAYPLDPPAPLTKDFYAVGTSGETTLHPQLGCIVVVRGIFEEGNYAVGNVTSPASLAERIAAKFLIQDPGGLGAATRIRPGSLEFYFEVVPVLSDNGKVFGLRPQALHIPKFASGDGLFGPSTRDYKIVLTFADAFSSDAFASAEFSYDDVRRDHARDGCVGKKSTDGCPAVELGGIRGWFATRPISDDVRVVLKKRQTAALTLKTAIGPALVTRARVPVADDGGQVRATLKTYCDALNAVNRTMPEALQQWDPSCPGELTLAKRDYAYALANETERLERVAADAFWDQKCVDSTTKAPLLKNEDNAVACLQTLAGPNRTGAGKFVLTATVIETRPGNKVAKFLAPAAEKVAPAVKSALKEEFDPVERQKAKDAADATALADVKVKRDARRATVLADDDAKSAQVSYDKAATDLAAMPSDPTLQIALIKAHMDLLKMQAAANDAYRLAGFTVPYPLVD